MDPSYQSDNTSGALSPSGSEDDVSMSSFYIFGNAQGIHRISSINYSYTHNEYTVLNTGMNCRRTVL